MTTFEQGFEEAERAADAAAKAVGNLLAATKQLKKAARDGDTAAIRRSSERLGLSMDAVRQEVANARGSWPFGLDDEEAYLRDDYEAELLVAARAAGLRMDQVTRILLVGGTSRMPVVGQMVAQATGRPPIGPSGSTGSGSCQSVRRG